MRPLIHLHILASGSKGNAAIVEGPEGSVLVDCGISRKRVLDRADELGVDVSLLRAVILTHEHSDHVSGAPVFFKRFGGPVFATPGTMRACTKVAGLPYQPLAHSDEVCLAGMTVRTFPTSHDVADPFGLHFLVQDEHGVALDSVGWCTDTGILTAQAMDELRGCRILGIEANHDVRMLRSGPYPPFLQARIGGTHGHLSNDQCAEALPRLVTEQTETVVALHLSEKNNLPSLALKALTKVAPQHVTVLAASQDQPLSIW